MAEIPVSFILEKISDFLQNEIQILQGVPEELESIRDDLETLKASLRAADLVEDSDHQLKQWVKQVRDIAYDIEDAIDDFTYHHADQQGNRIHGFLYKFCCFAKTLKGYHRTADDLRKIKSRIGNVSAWQSNNNDRFKKTDQGSSSRTPVNDALILDSVDLVGIEEPKEKLVKWLVESKSRRRKVVSVVGMGGLGKTTLVKQVYDDERVKKRFDVHVWIPLSHSLKLEDLLRNIVQQVFTAIRKPVPEGIDDMNSEWLKVAIKPYLQQWSFRQNTCPPYLVEVSGRILEKCEGLPFAIVAIGGLLATKTGTIAEWEMIYRSLGAIIKDNDKVMNLTEVLSFSFKYLPYHLKSCFLYLSIFPENHLIETMRLMRLWIAEEFVEVKDGKTQEEVAKDYLNELLSRSLVQVSGRTTDGRVKTCRVHDLLREIIISKSKDQNFAAIAKDQNGVWPDKVRRLSLHNSMENMQQKRTTVSHLRSLFMFEVEDLLPNSPLHSLFSEGLRLLKVLDLRAVPLQTFPSEIVNLFLLRYLSLRETEIKIIPSSIGKLQNLQTLDLKHTHVTELPVEILKLKKLRHLLDGEIVLSSGI
ncbi:Disease resistance protein [Corchorus olitorius]|uniref:Disease resistance protein n=1 Tax=Corchorus olitorius TaxID=93759 RepID=A0A1R3JF68_9ROSI|nr:Disease resistance protein [Corchorus olitorius]